MPLEFRSEFTPDSAILYCSGTFSTDAQPKKLGEQVQELLKHRRKIVVDLGQLEYMDSATLSFLVAMYASVRTAGGEIRYRNLSTPVIFRKMGHSAAA